MYTIAVAHLLIFSLVCYFSNATNAIHKMSAILKTTKNNIVAVHNFFL